MSSNFFLHAFRNMRKHSGYLILNLVGLTIGLTSFILVSLYVINELTYDRFNNNHKNTYRIKVVGMMSGASMDQAVTAAPMAAALKNDYPEIISFPSESGQVKISAGWLIEKCGWKGKRVGNVGTSPDHALVICNFGNATGAEILEFAMRIKEEVAGKFGIMLEEEVNIF